MLLQYTLAIFFVWLLAVAGWHKLNHREYYVDLIREQFPSLASMSGGVVYLLAVTEISLAAGLVISPLREAAWIGVAVLLAGYLTVMTRQLARGRIDMKCGCAGPASDLRISPVLLARNAVLILLALAAAVAPAGATPLTASLLLTALPAGLFMIGVYLCVEQLMLNAQRFRQIRG